ncbi:MAG: LolA family protein [Nocardioides sp.]
MTVFARRPHLRWLVPLLAVLLLTAGGSALGAITAAARGGLPHRSAAQLLVDVQKARLDGLSGTIVQNADLGLPSLPGAGGSGSSDMTSLVSGSHTLRLWYAGPRHVRLALLGSLGESDVIRNGSDLWTWSSSTRSATHRTLPSHEGARPQGLAPGTPVTPQQLADQALKAISPSTRVSTDGTAMVAGRAAYELLLQPRDTRSLVGSVRIAVDGRTHVPTRVQVFAKGAGKPAFEVGFTSFDPTAPALSVFGFNPPPGTTVKQLSGAPHLGHWSGGEHSGSRQHAVPPMGGTGPTVVGTGWTSVAVGTLPGGLLSGSGTARTLLKSLPRVSGSWGSGHLLQGTLFSVLLTDNGKVVAGAVPPALLYQALGAA